MGYMTPAMMIEIRRDNQEQVIQAGFDGASHVTPRIGDIAWVALADGGHCLGMIVARDTARTWLVRPLRNPFA
jgi:hypothetical protein